MGVLVESPSFGSAWAVHCVVCELQGRERVLWSKRRQCGLPVAETEHCDEDKETMEMMDSGMVEMQTRQNPAALTQLQCSNKTNGRKKDWKFVYLGYEWTLDNGS